MAVKIGREYREPAMSRSSRYFAGVGLTLAAPLMAGGASAFGQDSRTEVITHRVLAADASKQRIGIVDEEGALVWEYPIQQIHDLHRLDDGNLLFQTSWTRIVEVSPEKELVWSYDAESGPARILEVDRAGDIVHVMEMKLENPHHHYDTRLDRKLENGNYLVCHEGHHQLVREYEPDGRVAWEYAPGSRIFSAVRLETGNTLIGTGEGHGVIEVTPDGQTAWSLESDDLPGITLAWVTTVEALPNGHLVIGNCHAGAEQLQSGESVPGTVSPLHDARGRGVGERMLLGALELARNRGAIAVTLETNRQLKPAIHLYEKVGFREVAPAHESAFSRCVLAMRLEI